jgi:hypothetical protein
VPTESQILQSLDVDDPEEDPRTDVATDAIEEEEGKLPDDHQTEELDDGGAVIRFHDEKEVQKAKDFYVNLAEDLPEDVLNSIAVELMDLYDQDVEDRALRDKQQDMALEQTGFTGKASKGAEFDGASSATYPLIAEVAIDFSARAIKELWPAGGPAKSEIIGTPDDRKEAKADRKVKFLNWQLRKQMPNTRNELEKILTQVPMGGVQYSKLYWDTNKRKPVHEPVWVDEIVLPESATSFYGSPRKAHRQKVDQYLYDYRVRNGVYRDLTTTKIVTAPDQTKSEQTSAKIEGKQQNAQNMDGVRLIVEFDVQLTLPDEKRGITDPQDTDLGPAPYLVSIDAETQKVLSVYRNWDENDEHEESLVHIIEWPFLPWRGAMAIGVPQVLGGLAIATTGSLRSLLDSALINNFPGGMRLKSGPMGGQSVNVQGEQTNEVEGGIMADDIRKVFMPVPLNPTSQVLMSLLEFLVQAGKDVVKTTLDEANDNTNVPVGTIMARIEQQMVVFSAIHSRLHDAMGKFLMVLHRLDATYLEDEDVLAATGEQMCFKADFDAPDDVVPVSDPEIFCELQRVEQANALIQRATARPDIYDVRKVEERYLKVMKIPNGEQYLQDKPEPKPMNAVNENVACALGRPVVAFPDQDHLAHIQTHLNFIQDPMFGQNPIMAPQAIGGLLNNIKEHMLFWYANELAKMAETAYGKGAEGFAELMTIKDSTVTSALDGLLAAASNNIHQHTPQIFGKLPTIIQQAQQTLQKFSPPQPMDPSVVASQKVQADTQIANQKLQLEQQELAQEAALHQGDNQQKNAQFAAQLQTDAKTDEVDQQTKGAIALANNETTRAVAQGTNQTKVQVTNMDNETALQIVGAKLQEAAQAPQAHPGINVTDGKGVGEGGVPKA